MITNILIIPIETKTNSMNGSLKFLQTVDEIASDYEIDLKSIYAIPTKYNKGKKDDKIILETIKDNYHKNINACPFLKKCKYKLFEPIGERTIFTNSQAKNMSIQDYASVYDKNNNDILLLIEKICKTITKDNK